MKRMANVVWKKLRPLSPLILTAGFWIVFRKEDFTEGQSFVLALLFGLICSVLLATFGVVKELARAADFEPYDVSVKVRWHDLLLKYKILESEEAWQEAMAKAVEKGAANAEFRVREGFSFTVLSSLTRSLNPLLYWNDRRWFLSGRPSFSEPVESLLGVQVGDKKLRWPIPATLFFGTLPGEDDGYAMGLRVGADWWNSVKTPDLADTETYNEPDSGGAVYLILARLPECGLQWDWEGDGKNRRDELHRHRKELAARGWSYSVEDECWQHTYFSVWVDDIRCPSV